MKKLIVAVVVCISGLNLYAGDPVKSPVSAYETGDGSGFAQGKFYLSGGLGAFNFNSIVANKIKTSIAPRWKSVSVDGLPIWFAKAEYAVSRHSGVGLSFAHGGFSVTGRLPDSITKYNIPVEGELHYRTWSLTGRYNFHFIPESNFDLYAGIGLGFRNNKFEVKDNDPDKNWWNFPVDLSFVNKVIPNSLSIPTVGADFTLGMRYHIVPPLAVYAELGVAKSVAQGGIVLRF